MKVAIIQGEVPPYRVDFFNLLNASLDGGLTLFSGQPNQDAQCKQVTLSCYQLTKFIGVKGITKKSFEEFDIVVMMFDMRWLLLYSLLLFDRKRLILWGHGMGGKNFLWPLKRWMIQHSLGLITYEPRGADYFRARGVNARKLAYAGNTVSIANAQLSKADRKYFLYVGRLQLRKDLAQLIRAFALLPPETREVSSLVLLGDGDIQQDLIDLAKDLDVEKECHFVAGTYDAEALKHYFDEAIAYVSPGHVGLGVLSAFAYGVPVITRKEAPHAPEVENIKDGENGFLTGPDDEHIMAAMRSYLLDPDMHRRHCEDAYRWYANERTMEKMVSRFTAALSDFSSNSGAQSGLQ